MKRLANSLINGFSAFSTFAELRRTPRRFADRAAFLAWQERKLSAWLSEAPGQVAYYRGRAGQGARLEDMPIIDKATLMSDFAAFNRPGITAEQGWDAFSGNRMIGPWHVGASTGTSGNRGLFVISDRERYAWLGAILAKTMPDIWKGASERIAVALPLHTRLYDSANSIGPVSLRFFDVTKGPEAWSKELARFRPTILIAPPKVLRWLSEEPGRGVRHEGSLHRVFSGAEVLDPLDRSAIEAGLRLPVEQIYMATEGLLGVTCPHGRLHLCEDILTFELESSGAGDLVSPIITDFRRRTQVMLRYRLNDLLRISETPCPCGSPCLVVDEVVGRDDDTFLLEGRGGPAEITPDVLRNAVVDADRTILDFRIRQTGANRIELALDATVSEEALGRAVTNLRSVCLSRGLGGVHVGGKRMVLVAPVDRKLRRVERLVGREGGSL